MIIPFCHSESRKHLKHFGERNEEKGKMAKIKYDTFNAYMVRGAAFAGDWEIPVIDRVQNCIPTDLVLFTEMKKTSDTHAWVHFFTDDRRFTALWNHPTRHLSQLKRFEGVISPDFSIYRDMPLCVQLYGVYQNRAMAYWLSTQGIPVIPNVRWGDERSYAFCFEGLPTHSTVAVGSNGCLRNPQDRMDFQQGFDEMCRQLSPHTVLVYGPAPAEIFQKHIDAGIQIVPYTAEMRRIHEASSKGGLE